MELFNGRCLLTLATHDETVLCILLHGPEKKAKGPANLSYSIVFTIAVITGSVALSRYCRERPSAHSTASIGQLPPIYNPSGQITNTFQYQSPASCQNLTPGTSFAHLKSPDQHAYRDQHELGCNNAPTPELPVNSAVYGIDGPSSLYYPEERI